MLNRWQRYQFKLIFKYIQYLILTLVQACKFKSALEGRASGNPCPAFNFLSLVHWFAMRAYPVQSNIFAAAFIAW